MRSSLSSSNRILRGVVASGCALAFSLALLAAWGALGEVTLPALYDAAQGDSDRWFAYGFWSLIRQSLPLWAVALWMTAIGSFFETGGLFRVARGAVWLVPAALCAAAILVQADVGGLGTLFLIPQDSFRQLASAEVILP
jgi:hypothetical protein